MIAEILGVPERDREKVLRFGAAAAPSLDLGLSWREFRRVESALREFDEWLGQHLAALRRQPGRRPAQPARRAQEDGVGLTDTELKSTAGLVLAAGFETTVNLLGNGIALLAGDPEQLRLLTERAELWPNAVDEVLRVDPPVLLTGRIAATDTEVAGVRMRRGSVMVGLLAGANRRSRGLPGARHGSTSLARTPVSTSRSRPDGTTASVRRWHGWRGRSGCGRCSSVTPTCGSSRGPYAGSTRILRGYEQLPVTLRP